MSKREHPLRIPRRPGSAGPLAVWYSRRRDSTAWKSVVCCINNPIVTDCIVISYLYSVITRIDSSVIIEHVIIITLKTFFN